jgi:hypothetical protein
MDPWSTHLPVLQVLGKGIHRVLELGAGMYSTSCFLDRTFYPDLNHLLSVEHDPAWAERILARISDPRYQLIVAEEPIERALPTIISLDQYDLILVDNSDKPERRVSTIRYVCSQNVGQAKVVFHDVEREDYRAAITGFPNMIVHETLTPHTAVCWR